MHKYMRGLTDEHLGMWYEEYRESLRPVPYPETFGMTKAWRGPVRDDGYRAIYLTDGYINMAVLPARGGREGIDHFGFQVENMEETLQTAQASGAQSGAEKKPRDGRFAEMGVHDPVGQLVDVTVHGWKS